MSLFISSLLTLSPSGNIQHYSTDEITPAEFQNLINNQNNNLISYLLLSIHDANTDERYYIDYGRLVTDYAEPANADTWSAVINLLETNDEFRIGHRWEHMSARDVIPYSDVTIWDCMHTLNTFSINYGDSETGNYGEYLNRFHMKDLRISIVSDAETIPDLTKSIPVVNGFVCKPVCVTGDAAHSTGNVIFAKYAGKMAFIVLLKFSYWIFQILEILKYVHSILISQLKIKLFSLVRLVNLLLIKDGYLKLHWI